MAFSQIFKQKKNQCRDAFNEKYCRIIFFLNGEKVAPTKINFQYLPLRVVCALKNI